MQWLGPSPYEVLQGRVDQAVNREATLDSAIWKKHANALRHAADAASDHEERDVLTVLAEDCEAMAAKGSAPCKSRGNSLAKPH